MSKTINRNAATSFFDTEGGATVWQVMQMDLL